jgi:hypothetical protein
MVNVQWSMCNVQWSMCNEQCATLTAGRMLVRCGIWTIGAATTVATKFFSYQSLSNMSYEKFTNASDPIQALGLHPFFPSIHAVGMACL